MMVLLVNIITNTFVRTERNDDRVQFLWTQMEAGEVLDPILLIPEYTVDSKGRLNFVPNSQRMCVVDGRHRFHLFDAILDCKEVKALIITSGIETEAELIALAFQCNYADKGPLPPTNDDIQHTVTAMLERKVPRKDIPAMLGLPELAVKSFVRKVEEQWERAKVLRAVKRVANDSATVHEAAKAEDVSPEKVRAQITSAHRKTKERSIDKARGDIDSGFRSVSGTVQATAKSLTKKYEDGDVTAKDVRSLFDLAKKKYESLGKVMTDLRKRFEDKAGEH